MTTAFNLEYQNYRNICIKKGQSPRGKITYRNIRACFEDMGLLEPLNKQD